MRDKDNQLLAEAYSKVNETAAQHAGVIKFPESNQAFRVSVATKRTDDYFGSEDIQTKYFTIINKKGYSSDNITDLAEQIKTELHLGDYYIAQ